LKAPVVNIEGLIGTLKLILEQNSYMTGEIPGILEMIDLSTRKFTDTINDLATITTVQKKQEESNELINLREIVNDVEFSIADLMMSSSAEIIIDDSELREFHFSRKKIKSIFYNLISNAIKYRHPDRTPVIYISTKKGKDFHCISFTDNGLGVSEKNQGRIFHMFQRFHDHVEGSGIGLYIVKRLLENSGGRIEVESEQDKGSIFRVYLPANE
jgi:signal transduction histidine kinase